MGVPADESLVTKDAEARAVRGAVEHEAEQIKGHGRPPEIPG